LLTISNALVRDLYFRGTGAMPSPEQRVILTKFTLLAVALSAAFVAALKPSEILPMVSASFSLAASAFVPVMVLGIFWRGTTRKGAVAGMLAGLGVAVYYLLSHVPAVRAALPGWLLADGLWFGIQPISAGVFGRAGRFCGGSRGEPARGGDGIAIAAMVDQADFTQFLDAGIERVGRDATDAVLQQPEGLRVAIAQCPQHAQGVPALQPFEQLKNGDVFFGAHRASPCA
jgi:hypothetical protein